MNQEKAKKAKQTKRHRRVRAKVQGTAYMPSLSVFKSNKGFYLQLIDDDADTGKTLVSANMKEVKKGKKKKSEKAFELGKVLAEKAQEKKIKKVVFDKGSYRYHGQIKAVAEGAREGGLDF